MKLSSLLKALKRQPLVAGVFAGLTLLTPASLAANKITDFAMLPAVQVAAPEQAVLLDITRTGKLTVAVGEQGRIIYSKDFGKSWQQGEVPVSVTLTSVFFVDEQYGWATGHQGVILATRDGGQSWVKQLDGSSATQAIINRGTILLAKWRKALEQDDDNDDLYTKIDDLDFLLEDKTAALAAGPSEPFLDIWFKNKQIGFAIGAYGFLFKTADGGNNWQIHDSYFSNIDKFHFYAIHPLSSEELLLAGESGTVWHSEDSGESWERVEVPYDGSFFGITEAKDGALLLYGLRGNIWRSQDNDFEWQKVATEADNTLLAGYLLGDQLTLLGTRGQVLISQDNGQSFKTLQLQQRSTLSGVIGVGNNVLIATGKDGLLTIPLTKHATNE